MRVTQAHLTIRRVQALASIQARVGTGTLVSIWTFICKINSNFILPKVNTWTLICKINLNFNFMLPKGNLLGYNRQVQKQQKQNIKWLFLLLRVCYKTKYISHLPTPILNSWYIKKKQKSYLKSRPAQLTNVAVWPSPAVNTCTLEAARCVSARSSIQTWVRQTLIHVYNSI